MRGNNWTNSAYQCSMAGQEIRYFADICVYHLIKEKLDRLHPSLKFTCEFES